MNQAEKFLTYCKLTCFGGSEAGECSCKKPSDCLMRNEPGYGQARKAARDRFVRIFRKKVVEEE